MQVSGGLDLKYGLTSSLWPMTAAELAGGMQQTNTISITLNGVDAPLSAAVGGGAAINDNYTPLPTILAASKRLADANNKQDRSQHGSGPPKSRGHLEWPTPLKPQGPGPHAQP